jgi:hypothetical protein
MEDKEYYREKIIEMVNEIYSSYKLEYIFHVLKTYLKK